jgi:hypothetical protein
LKQSNLSNLELIIINEINHSSPNYFDTRWEINELK